MKFPENGAAVGWKQMLVFDYDHIFKSIITFDSRGRRSFIPHLFAIDQRELGIPFRRYRIVLFSMVHHVVAGSWVQEWLESIHVYPFFYRFLNYIKLFGTRIISLFLLGRTRFHFLHNPLEIFRFEKRKRSSSINVKNKRVKCEIWKSKLMTLYVALIG